MMTAARLADLRQLADEWKDDHVTVTNQDYLWARDLLEVLDEVDRLRATQEMAQ